MTEISLIVRRRSVLRMFLDSTLLVMPWLGIAIAADRMIGGWWLFNLAATVGCLVWAATWAKIVRGTIFHEKLLTPEEVKQWADLGCPVDWEPDRS